MKYESNKVQKVSEPFWGEYETNNKEKNKLKDNVIQNNNGNKNNNDNKNMKFNNKNLIINEKKEKQKINNRYFSSIKDGNITSTRLVATMKDLCNSDKEKLAKLITKLAVEETKNQKLELKNKNYKTLLMEERIKNEQLQKTHNG